MLLIDGHNLIHARPAKGAHDALRQALVAEIDAYCARRDQRALVCFDGGTDDPRLGPRRLRHSARVSVQYAGPRRKADDDILKRLRATRDKTAYTIVTTDREIRDEATRLGFRVRTAEDFAAELDEHSARAASGGPGDPKEHGISPAEADAWMREFGLEEP